MSDAFIYDVVDYPMYLHPQMHPSRIGAIARLHGIAAPSPVQCRLLDVGCGDGLQLIALDPRMRRHCLGQAHTFSTPFFCVT